MKKFLLIVAIFLSIFLIDQVQAQEIESLEKDFVEDPVAFFSLDGRGIQFVFFLTGIALYAMFVWHFYQFISRRDLIPLFYLKHDEGKTSKTRVGMYIAAYVVLFPSIIFVWFSVLGFFIFIIAQEMPIQIAFFISMAIIGVVRIMTYFREEIAKDVAKMIPLAILSLFLTSAVVYTDPNFIEPGNLKDEFDFFVDRVENVIPFVMIVVMYEVIFRIIFLIKRRFLPVADKKFEDELEKKIDERLKTHYKRIQDKEKNVEKKIEEMMKKLKDSEKNL